MANISILSRLVGGVQKNVDLSSNTLVVGALTIGATNLSETILGRLISLQNGSDVDATYHTHDGRYFTESELGSSSPGTAGSTRIGDDNSYSNFSPSTATVKGALSAIDSALGSATASTAIDSVFRIKNFTDNTKQIAFSAAGIATGTTRTITMPDADVNLADANNAILKNGSRAFTANQPMGSNKLTGLAAGTGAGDSVRYEQAILASGVNAFTANQDMGGNKITGMADPTAQQDAATKAYVDAVALGLAPKKAVKAASTANLTLSGAQTIDGIAVIAGDRVLAKDQTLPENNGIYVVAAGAWSRATDFDSLSPIDEINGAWVPVQFGTANAGKIFVQYGAVVTLGTDPINFEFYNPIASLIGGDSISVSGSTINIDLAAISGLESTSAGNPAGQLRIKLEAVNPSLKFSGSNELGIKFDSAGAVLAGASGVAVQVDGSSIEISGNALRVKDAGITLAKMASNSVDENKIVSTSFSASGAIAGGSGTKVAVQVDSSTIEINSNALRVKAAGIQASHLNTNVADQKTIVGGAGTALAVAEAPLAKRTMVAGEAFAAGTSFAVRFAISGETAGRVYKADKDASGAAKWAAIGIAISAAGVSAGGNVEVYMLGEMPQGASDVAYNAADIGKEIFVGTSGALILGAALAGTANEAAYCIGVVQTTTKVWVDFKQLRGIA
jgi:hypothetical protein